MLMPREQTAGQNQDGERAIVSHLNVWRSVMFCERYEAIEIAFMTKLRAE
jgi:hypothetical protein